MKISDCSHFMPITAFKKGGRMPEKNKRAQLGKSCQRGLEILKSPFLTKTEAKALLRLFSVFFQDDAIVLF